MKKLKDTAAVSDLIAVGHSGIITSTGGSINAEVEVEEVLKGPRDCKRIRIAFATVGMTSPPELEPGERYIFFLQACQVDELPVYGLVGNDPNTIIPFNGRIVQEIRKMLTAD